MTVQSWAVTVELTEDGLGLTKGNQGTSLRVSESLQITALTKITDSFENADIGTIYLEGKKGLGVQNINLSGSKEISGKGADQDEALVFDFTNVQASSLELGLDKYKADKTDPVISLILSDGAGYTFTENSNNWDDYITSQGKEKVSLNIGSLLQAEGVGQDVRVNKMYVMETSEHLYVTSVKFNTSAVPEPATLAFLFTGMICLRLKKDRKNLVNA
jgi:hypothetical protein